MNVKIEENKTKLEEKEENIKKIVNFFDILKFHIKIFIDKISM